MTDKPAGRLTAERALAEAIDRGDLPGAVFAAGVGEEVRQVVVAGFAQRHGGEPRPMRRDTLFDLASLTKVVATTSCALVLAGQGRLGLDDNVSTYLPEFSGAGRDEVTVRQLLSHTSGLPAEVKFWLEGAVRPVGRPDIAATPLEAPPGTRVEYSDVGFMLLGMVVEVCAGMPIDEAVAALVTAPLGMRSTYFNPGPEDRGRAAATEVRPDGTAVVGVVHDENAAFFGGAMGHAGLFSTIDDLARYAGSWLYGQTPLSFKAWCPEACACQTEGLSGRRGLGWALRGDSADFLGEAWPGTTASHSGFTGTSIALDPVSGYWGVLLTNDVHYGRGRGTIRGLRRQVYETCGPLAA